ncbi:MAG: hypothetical protein IT337_04190 [Thermomicrobiales bacterium]|nr:hypothetical protein [Thermomicrobiales bacterium]
MTESPPLATAPAADSKPAPPTYVFGAAGATTQLIAIAIDEEGRTFAASDVAAGNLEANGTVAPFAGLPAVQPRPLALAAAEGIVAVVEAKPAALHVLTPSGEILASLVGADLPAVERPAGVAVGAGRIAICCPERNVTIVLDARTLALVMSIAIPEPVALATTSTGKLLIASRSERTVAIYDRSGERVGALRGVVASGAPALHGSAIAIPDPGAKGVLIGDFATGAFGWLRDARISSPAAVAFLPSGRLLVGQRTAPTLLRYDPGEALKRPAPGN